MYKRLLSVFLSITLLVVLVPTQIFAAERDAVKVPATINWHDLSPNTTVAAVNGSGGQPSVQPSFGDVEPTDWFYNAVTYVQQNGIFNGTGNDSFSPSGTMTRAMYVTVLGRMAGVDASKYTAATFADIQADAWYAPYVQWAVEQGITSGTGNDSFTPDMDITREQMATLTLRFFEAYHIPYQTNASVTTKPKDLSSISPWAVDAIVKLWQAGLLTGDANGNYNPQSKATRAEAATFAMRSNEVVKTAAPTEPTKPAEPTKTPTPTPTPTNGGSNPGGGDTEPNTTSYTVTFETNGGSAINSLTLSPGAKLNNLPAPRKAGSIFQGWYKDSVLTQVLLNDDVASGNMTLYAKYIESVDRAVQSVPSVTVLDQAPSFTIGVNDATGRMTASQVKAAMEFGSPANPQFAGIAVTGANGHFTVASAAQDGNFEEGNTYQLTLKDTNLSYQGQDATTTLYVFNIAKQEVLNVPLNPDMIYLPFADVSHMLLDGANVDSPAIPVMTTGVGSGATLNESNTGSGTFKYSGDKEIQAGDIVAIYEGVRPDLRTAETSGTDNGNVAYIRITAVNGDTYTYTHADSKQVLTKPDVLPVSTSADTDGDTANHSITVVQTVMNFSGSQYAPLGLNELTVVNVGDFIAFYNGAFTNEATSAGYGRITSIMHDAEMDIITYTDATLDQVTSALDVYQQQTLDGNRLLSDSDIATLEGRIMQQAIASGFVKEAADYLAAVALQTDAVKKRSEVKALSAASGSNVSVENLTVAPSISDQLSNLSRSGISVTLQVRADIVIHLNEESDLVIHLTGKFVEEMSFDLSVNGDTQWHWYWFIPVLEDYIVTANLDAYTFTGINITAEMATVQVDKLHDALTDWLGAKRAGRLGVVQDIATELQALIDGVEDTGVDATTLKERYKSILENETEWVSIIRENLVNTSMRVCLGIVEINFSVDFVVSANVNLTVGVDFNYKSAKRYSATVRILSFTGSSNTVSLSGDGDYKFRFYVLGTMGVRAGLQVSLRAGVGSVNLNSIGISVEPGLYLNLWGYFYYELKNTGGKRTTNSLGALYVELGIYLESAVGAQLGDGLLSASVPLYDHTWPLYSVGTQTNIVDFAYSQTNMPSYDLSGSLRIGNFPELSGNLMRMEVMDIKTGESVKELFDRSNFTITPDSSDFTYDPKSNLIGVSEALRQRWLDGYPISARGNLILTWKNASGSISVAPTRSIPLSVDVKVGDTSFVLAPMNGNPWTTISGQYGTPVAVVPDPVYPGYTFAGWYTAPTGGTRYTLPAVMPLPQESRTLYARWTAQTNTPYRVEHYLFNPNVTYTSTPNVTDVTLAETELLAGTTGAKITLANPNRFAAQGYHSIFTRNGINVGAGYINADGSTVVKVYYYPDARTLTFKSGYGDQAVVGKLNKEIGSNISWTPAVTRPGYTFAGWSPTVPDTMPSQDTTYTATWRAREDIPYRVVHLQQDITRNALGLPILGNTYTIVDQESYTGTTDTATSAVTPKSYEGFTFDGSVPGTVQSSTIAGEGTTILKLYYTRNTYTATFNLNGGTRAGSTEPHTVIVPYGASISQPYVTKGTEVLSGWSPAIPAAMPANNVSFTAQWSERTATYTVTHYRADAAGQYTLTEPETLSGPVGATVTATPKSYEGFTYDSSVPGTVASGTVPTSGTLQLKLYYKRNSYKLTFNPNGGIVNGVTTGNYVVNMRYGDSLSAISLIPITRAGYVFAGWSPALPSTMPAGDLTTVAQWTPDYTIAAVHIDNTTPGVGDTLNAVVTMGDGNAAGSRVTYQWKVETVTGGTYGNFTDTGIATASYTVADADKGKRLQVVVTGVSPITGSRTATTDVVSIPITSVTIDKVNPAVGDTLSASVTMGDDSAAGTQVTYQWQVETDTSGTFANATGEGRTSKNYTVAQADVGKRLRVVVSYMGRAASAVPSAPTSAVVVPLPEWIDSADALDLHGATFTVVSSTEVTISGAALTKDWTLPEGKTLNLRNSTLNGFRLTLANGATLKVSDLTVDGYIDVGAGATLNASNSTLGGDFYAWHIAENATLNVSGTFTLVTSAQLMVDGTFHISSSATVINNGGITWNKDFTNNGTITNNSRISIWGTMTNYGTVTISSSGTITNFGRITNNGTITNNGMIANDGTITGPINGNAPL
ncbi:InlB B-repeat-containing protein [Paenibacillus sp. HJGM_3]|uniref:InlB B-repeat-containing protein n=1 Tax=Paenibacillus sp. HJGM_3 TaxID=3379816 RepID=UPI0038592721